MNICYEKTLVYSKYKGIISIFLFCFFNVNGSRESSAKKDENIKKETSRPNLGFFSIELRN